MVKRSNWPGGSPPSDAVQVIVLTAWVTCPSSVCTGLARVVLSTVIVQPGMVFTLTDGIGDFVGRSTSSFTVLAACSSFGTEKLRIWELPFGALSGTTSTCAPAG